MDSTASAKLYTDDVSLVVILLDANPLFWASLASSDSASSFSNFLSHVLPFISSILLINPLNHIVVIAAGVNSCDYIYDSGGGIDGTSVNEIREGFLRNLEEFVERDVNFCEEKELSAAASSSLLSGSLSLALCYIQRVLRSGKKAPQPRILCLQGSPDGPEQYVAVMNAIFSAQRSMVPIDACVVGNHHSPFLQQASHITGGIYLKPPQPEALFQYLSMVFAVDLQSRSFLQLPKTAGVDFRASCFCHKKTIDKGYVCSVCLSIFCKAHKKCATCSSDFKMTSAADSRSRTEGKRRNPEP